MIENKMVSVIIPTYGRSSTLIDAVRSVLVQDYKKIEVIVVDDNNDEEMIELVKRGLALNIDDKRLIYYSDKINRGGAGARNKGIELSQGEYITFLDDDDLYIENKISKQLYFLNENNLDVCVCDMFFMKNGKSYNVNNCISRVNSLKEFILNGNCYTPMIFCKKDILVAIGGFSETPRFQDHILMIKILEYTKAVKRLPEKLFIHNHHNEMRITYSDKSIHAYHIREKYERRNISILNKNELNEFEFKKAMVKLKISRIENDFKKTKYYFFLALKLIRKFGQCKTFIKTIVIIIFFGKRNI